MMLIYQEVMIRINHTSWWILREVSQSNPGTETPEEGWALA